MSLSELTTTTNRKSYLNGRLENIIVDGDVVLNNTSENQEVDPKILIRNSTNNSIEEKSSSLLETINNNIYDNDGQLNANRTLNGNGNDLSFDNVGDFDLDAQNFILRNIQDDDNVNNKLLLLDPTTDVVEMTNFSTINGAINPKHFISATLFTGGATEFNFIGGSLTKLEFVDENSIGLILDTSNTEVIIQRNGNYLITGYMNISNTSTGTDIVHLRFSFDVNNVNKEFFEIQLEAGKTGTLSYNFILPLTSEDRLEMFYQNIEQDFGQIEIEETMFSYNVIEL